MKARKTYTMEGKVMSTFLVLLASYQLIKIFSLFSSIKLSYYPIGSIKNNSLP